MAIEPANLIQVQSHLQDPGVTNEDLIKYANNSNPEVPSFLALIEMNRRKQISNTADLFNKSNQASIKDQVTSALTQPAAGVNMAANPFTKGLTAAAPGVNMAASPFTKNPALATPGVNPAAMPAQPNTAPVKMAAEGGLMSLPVGHFSEQSYAGGGIVAFGDPTLNPNEDQVVPKPDSQYQGILASLPGVTAPKDKTAEELWADKQARDKLTGVSADPYADVKAREKAREERQAANYAQNGMDRLMAQLSSFATADPAKGLGYAGAVSAEASAKLEREQNALRDKEEAAQIEFARGIAKEEDARKRGDSDGIASALAAQQKAKLDFQKAEHDRGILAAHIYQTQEQAATRREQTQARLDSAPSADDKLYNSIMGRVNQSKSIASLAKRLQEADIGSDEYNTIQMQIYNEMKPYFAQHPELMPSAPEPTVANTPAKKTGFWASLFGGSKAPESTGKTVSFSDLPKQ